MKTDCVRTTPMMFCDVRAWFWVSTQTGWINMKHEQFSLLAGETSSLFFTTLSCWFRFGSVVSSHAGPFAHRGKVFRGCCWSVGVVVPVNRVLNLFRRLALITSILFGASILSRPTVFEANFASVGASFQPELRKLRGWRTGDRESNCMLRSRENMASEVRGRAVNRWRSRQPTALADLYLHMWSSKFDCMRCVHVEDPVSVIQICKYMFSDVGGHTQCVCVAASPCASSSCFQRAGGRGTATADLKLEHWTWQWHLNFGELLQTDQYDDIADRKAAAMCRKPEVMSSLLTGHAQPIKFYGG